MTSSLDDLPARMVEKIIMNGEGCWMWNGAKGRKGYGSMHYGGRTNAAHRVAYIILKGPIATGMHVDHLCFQHACVNPEHMRLTTPKQNNEHRGGLQANNTSGVRNVYLHPRSGRWRVSVQHAGRPYSGGYFTDIKDAEQAAIALRARLFTHDDGRRV